MKRKHAHLEHERRDVLSQIKMAEDNGIIHPSGVIGSTTSAIVACEKRIFNINKELEELNRVLPTGLSEESLPASFTEIKVHIF